MLKSLFALGIAATVSMMATAASDSSMRDVLANAAGAFAGIVIATLILRRPARPRS